MDIDKLNIYKRLRDHFIPSAVLDEIFRKEDDMKTLKKCIRFTNQRWL